MVMVKVKFTVEQSTKTHRGSRRIALLQCLFQLLAEQIGFPLHQKFQTGSGAHPALYSIGKRGSLSGSRTARVLRSTHIFI
jgi:hypothetical protein